MKIRSNFKKFIFIKVQFTFCAAGSTSIGVLLQSSWVYTQCPKRAAHHSHVINCYQLFRNYQQLLSTLSEHQQLVTSCHYVCAVLALAFSCASRTLKNLNSCCSDSAPIKKMLRGCKLLYGQICRHTLSGFFLAVQSCSMVFWGHLCCCKVQICFSFSERLLGQTRPDNRWYAVIMYSIVWLQPGWGGDED